MAPPDPDGFETAEEAMVKIAYSTPENPAMGVLQGPEAERLVTALFDGDLPPDISDFFRRD